jgi:hypothetical protein
MPCSLRLVEEKIKQKRDQSVGKVMGENNGSGLYSKALKQDAPGIANGKVFNCFIDDIKRGKSSTKLPIKPRAKKSSATWGHY